MDEAQGTGSTLMKKGRCETIYAEKRCVLDIYHVGKCKYNAFEGDKPQEATRQASGYRFDILDPAFIRAMAQVGELGATKYGDYNWHKSRLTGDKGPVNHMLQHVNAYQRRELHDVFNTVEHQLAAVAFNAMMEFYYYKHYNDIPGEDKIS